MTKYLVLDTNVLLNDPSFLSRDLSREFGHEETRVVVPVHALKELDTFKKSREELLAANARAVIRELDKLTASGSLIAGVRSVGDTIVCVALRNDQAIHAIEQVLGNAEHQQKDFYILAAAYELAQANHDVVLYTHDNCLRVQAGILGIPVNQELAYSELYTGHAQVQVDQVAIADYFQRGSLALPGHYYPNQAITIVDESNAACRALGTISPESGLLIPLSAKKERRLMGKVTPRGEEQEFLVNFLLDPNIDLLTISGEAGTGKTLLTLAAALDMTMDKHLYDQVQVARPLVPMGEDIGYLPGTKEQKLEEWMAGIHDALDFIFGHHEAQKMAAEKGSKGQKSGLDTTRYYMDFVKKSVNIDALTYIRGRSLPRRIIFIDESQNGTFHQMKTIITRAGEGTKVILAGDPSQIDNRFLGPTSNGLSATIECWKESGIAAHLTLTAGQRSRLASEAIWRMRKRG